MRGLKSLVFCIAFIFASQAAADPLPRDLAARVDQFIDASTPEACPDDRVYALAVDNPAYADEIATTIVHFCGNPDEVEARLLGAIRDQAVRMAVIEAIADIRQEQTGGFGVAARYPGPGPGRGFGGAAENPAQDIQTPIQP